MLFYQLSHKSFFLRPNLQTFHIHLRPEQVAHHPKYFLKLYEEMAYSLHSEAQDFWDSSASKPITHQAIVPLQQQHWLGQLNSVVPERNGSHTAYSRNPLRRNRHTVVAVITGELPKAVLALKRRQRHNAATADATKADRAGGADGSLLICSRPPLHRGQQMRQIGIEPSAILLEPIGRNTAPAVTVAALQATSNGDDPILLVPGRSPDPRCQFRRAIEAGRKPAEEGAW